MRGAITLALALLAGSASAQGPDPATTPMGARYLALTTGFGTSVPGFGLSAELYFARGHASLFGGGGYIPHTHDGRGAAGMAAAGGLRAYTHGLVHRGYFEISFTPVAVELAPEGSELPGQSISYGPGVSIGYSLVKQSGFTLTLSIGVGQAITGPESVHGTQALSSLTIGHTWRR